ncbi:MAG: hypothetical protein HQM08_15710 [Candidatus Riflebacteria bacterium]|nr:hypothetical protein [Candidatus Riflebacteria bacterium]
MGIFNNLFGSIKDLILEGTDYVIQLLSFSNEIETMVDALNHKLEEPQAKLGIKLFSHPGGFTRELQKRRLNIATAYLKIARNQSPENVDERLAALQILIDASLHAKALNMPLNTARVQIKLMKKAVKSLGKKRIQNEAMTDFGRASFGQEQVVRYYLNKLQMIEVPETDKPLKDLEMGWDDHVHDTLSEGRKTPTQILLDAFVKGISELALVYSHLEQRSMIHEAITSGKILGIKVNIGIEFSVGRSGNRRHFMYVPGTFDDSESFFDFFDKHEEAFAAFREGLRSNSENRRKTIAFAIERFNAQQLPRLNSGYQPDGPCWFAPLSLEDLDQIVGTGQPSRVHVGELLFQQFRDTFHKRVLFLKAEVLAAHERSKRGHYSEMELRNISGQYESLREFYEIMTPDALLSRYMDSRDVVDYDSVFLEEEALFPKLLAHGGKIIMIHPLELGLQNSIIYLLKNVHIITHVETLNLRDSVQRNPNHLIIFNDFIGILNNDSTEEILSFLEQLGISEVEPLVKKAVESVRGRGLIPVCGSDAIGRDPTIPGMGFIKAIDLYPSIAEEFKTQHFKIPHPIADLIMHDGKNSQPDEIAENSDIICMGKIGKLQKNLVGDEKEIPESIGLERFLMYLNPTLKNFLRVGVGFSAAYIGFCQNSQYQGSIGIHYAALWLFITFVRNILVDLVAASGLHFRAWSHKNINFDFAGESLFWTGWSVPVLNYVKTEFTTLWAGSPVGMLYEASKFFFVCLANGLYITTHNRLRNFDKKVIRANFFRSILAWPLATCFSPVGNALEIPTIVQAKFWSDVVAAVIEGSGKFSQRFKIRLRDLNEIIPLLFSKNRREKLTAMLDLLYVWAVMPRGQTGLKYLLVQKEGFWEKIFAKNRMPFRERQKSSQVYRNYYGRLIELFGDSGCLGTLNEFILKHYSDKESVFLTEMVGLHLEPFVTWLRSLKKIFNPEK